MQLRATFDEDAERYDTFRPRYRAALFNKLIADTGITTDSTLLEIGPGTGQATLPMAQTGAKITGIELGAELTAKAKRALHKYPNVNIMTGSFEEIGLPPSSFDLIYSATAFHWIDDAYKFTKTAKLLKPHGFLAIIHTEHVSDEKGDAFHKACQPIYDTYWPPKPNDAPPQLPTLCSLKVPYIDENLFKIMSFTVFPEVKTYSAADYAGLLSTYSPTITLPPAERKAFLNDIEKLINEQSNGTVEKHFGFTLTLLAK